MLLKTFLPLRTVGNGPADRHKTPRLRVCPPIRKQVKCPSRLRRSLIRSSYELITEATSRKNRGVAIAEFHHVEKHLVLQDSDMAVV